MKDAQVPDGRPHGSAATKSCLKIGVHSKRAKSEFSEFANGCKCFNINSSSRCGRVAQLGEHLLCKQGVAGSNPVTSTNFFSDCKGFPRFISAPIS